MAMLTRFPRMPNIARMITSLGVPEAGPLTASRPARPQNRLPATITASACHRLSPGAAASAELEELIPAGRPPGRPLQDLARFLARTAGERWDAMSRLWLNARHLSRYRPALRDRVLHQEALWRDRLSEVIAGGAADGTFRVADPVLAATEILVVLDGLGAHANTDQGGPRWRTSPS